MHEQNRIPNKDIKTQHVLKHHPLQVKEHQSSLEDTTSAEALYKLSLWYHLPCWFLDYQDQTELV